MRQVEIRLGELTRKVVLVRRGEFHPGKKHITYK
jgi:hypothetical protein